MAQVPGMAEIDDAEDQQSQDRQKDGEFHRHPAVGFLYKPLGTGKKSVLHGLSP